MNDHAVYQQFRVAGFAGKPRSQVGCVLRTSRTEHLSFIKVNPKGNTG